MRTPKLAADCVRSSVDRTVIVLDVFASDFGPLLTRGKSEQPRERVRRKRRTSPVTVVIGNHTPHQVPRSLLAPDALLAFVIGVCANVT